MAFVSRLAKICVIFALIIMKMLKPKGKNRAGRDWHPSLWGKKVACLADITKESFCFYIVNGLSSIH